jgi:hypothetical protein
MGRPPKPPNPGRLVPLSFRVTAAIRKKLEEAAFANGRSLSAEAESRLEKTFDREAQRLWTHEQIEAAVAHIEKATASFIEADARRRRDLDRREAALNRREAALKK